MDQDAALAAAIDVTDTFLERFNALDAAVPVELRTLNHLTPRE